MKNKVAIIIPVFNTEQYLNECLNSVCNQTMQELEILCVYTESKDKSLEILQKFEKKDRKDLFFINEVISGTVHSSEHGALGLRRDDFRGNQEGFPRSTHRARGYQVRKIILLMKWLILSKQFLGLFLGTLSL